MRQQVAEQVNSLLELLEHASEADEGMEVNAVMVMQGMDRIRQLLEIPSAGCDDQAALEKNEDVQ